MKETIENIKNFKEERRNADCRNAERDRTMRFKGKKGEDWGMRNVSAGWHEGIVERIEEFTNQDSGKKSLIFRVKVTKGDDEGLNVAIFAPWGKDFGERKIAAILAELDLDEAFEKAFPGDVSLFEDRVVRKIIEKVTSQYCKIFVVEDKSGRSNVEKFRNIKSTEDQEGSAKGKSKAGAKKTEAAGSAAGTGEAASSGDD